MKHLNLSQDLNSLLTVLSSEDQKHITGGNVTQTDVKPVIIKPIIIKPIFKPIFKPIYNPIIIKPIMKPVYIYPIRDIDRY